MCAQAEQFMVFNLTGELLQPEHLGLFANSLLVYFQPKNQKLGTYFVRNAGSSVLTLKISENTSSRKAQLNI